MPDAEIQVEESRKLTSEELAHYFGQQEYILFIRNKIDSDVGYYYWKNYIVSAFWSNIATPLNLTITFLTAITTAQSQNSSLLPQEIFSNIAIINLIITTLITFFRPHEQYNIYAEFVKQWVDLGVDLEKEFSSKASASDAKLVTLINIQKQEEKILIYKAIQDKCVNLRKAENKNIINSFTDCIFIMVYYCCMGRLCKGPKKWLDYDRKLHSESYKEFVEKKQAAERPPQEDRATETGPPTEGEYVVVAVTGCCK